MKSVVPHHNYHPESWSAQARQMCDEQVRSINIGMSTIADASEFFQTSYRHKIIRSRAAKRFGRLVREGKVYEKSEEN